MDQAELPSLPKVIVSILVWNGWDETIDCLQSLTEQTYKNIEIFVLNNGSREDRADEFTQKFPGITFFKLPENAGFSAGHNYIFEHTKERNADFYFFLNNDTTIEPNTIDELVQQAKMQPNVGTIHPIVLYKDQSKIWTFGGKIIYPLGAVQMLLKGTYYSESLPQISVQELTSGAAMFVSREIYEKVGGFDNQYFAYYEDTKFSLEINKRGLKNYFINIPGARCFHAVSSSAGFSGKNVFSKTQAYLRGRNGTLLIKEIDGINKILYILGRLVFAIPFELYKCRNNEARLAFITGMRDAFSLRLDKTYLKR